MLSVINAEFIVVIVPIKMYAVILIVVMLNVTMMSLLYML